MSEHNFDSQITYLLVRMIDEVAFNIINLEEIEQNPREFINKNFAEMDDVAKDTLVDNFKPHKFLDMEEFMNKMCSLVMSISSLKNLDEVREYNILETYLDKVNHKEYLRKVEKEKHITPTNDMYL